jgi:hypothetical protein
MVNFRNILPLLLLVLVRFNSHAQEEKIYQSIRLDSITIIAPNEFDIKRFVDLTINDTTYLLAFSNLRNVPHKISSKAMVVNRKENEKATRTIIARQYNSPGKMWIEKAEEKVTGKVYDKKGDHRYYTLEMYDRAFMPADTKRVERLIVTPKEVDTKQGRMQKHKDQAKLFMFNPGADIESVPLIGDKLSIFDDDMVKYYDYKISKVMHNNKSCYMFSCIAKPEFASRHTVIKELVTWYDVETMQVLQRSYHLIANTIGFSFDVKMKVSIAPKNGVFIPNKVEYMGYWNIPLKMRESIVFTHLTN